MTKEQQTKLEEELKEKSQEELIELIVKMQKGMDLTNSVYNAYREENEALRNGLSAVNSVLNLININ